MTDSGRKKPFRAGGKAVGIPELPTATESVFLADVSEFQPDVVDAAYLAWSKAVIIRACYGDAHDDKAWYGGQRRALLHSGGARFLGIYAYLVGSQSGSAQAQAFHRLVGAIRPGEVFIADFEEGSKSVLTAWYNEMLSLYGSSIKPYLWTYTGLNFGQSRGVLPVEWLADYTGTEPASPHKLWQFTDSYSVPGVGKCDASVFRGSIDQLAALAYQASKPAPAEWSYPAPSGLGIGQGTATIPVSWRPVAHAGVNAPSYTLQILDSAGKVFQSHAGVKGASLTVTIPRGTYTARVWAEEGPLAPPHADFKFTV